MEPLTNIDLKRCKWIGAIAVACTFAAELLVFVETPAIERAIFVQREMLRRDVRRGQVRSR